MNYAARVSDSIAAHMEAKNLPNSNCPIGDKVVNLLFRTLSTCDNAGGYYGTTCSKQAS